MREYFTYLQYSGLEFERARTGPAPDLKDELLAFQDILKEAGEDLAEKTVRRYRFLIINEHFLGHVTFHKLLCRALTADPEVDFVEERDTIRLDRMESFEERVARKLVSLRIPHPWIKRQDLDLGRWRFQKFIANLALNRAVVRLKETAYDALAFHSQTAGLASLDLMRRYPTLISMDITNTQASQEWNHPWTRWTYWPCVFWERKIFKAAARIACWSDWVRNAVLAENPGLSPEKVQTLTPGADLEAFLSIPLIRTGREKTQLLFVGGDFERKGGNDLIAVFEAYLQDTCELHIVSNGAPQRVPAGITVYRNLEAYSPELLQRYAEADIFVLPTRNEAYGLVFAEAMAAGLPVVTTDINAIPDMLPESSLPYLIAPGDQAGLLKAVNELKADPGLRNRLGSFGRERAMSHFNAQLCFARYVEVLKEIATLGP